MLNNLDSLLGLNFSKNYPLKQAVQSFVDFLVTKKTKGIAKIQLVQDVLQGQFVQYYGNATALRNQLLSLEFDPDSLITYSDGAKTSLFNYVETVNNWYNDAADESYNVLFDQLQVVTDQGQRYAASFLGEMGRAKQQAEALEIALVMFAESSAEGYRVKSADYLTKINTIYTDVEADARQYALQYSDILDNASLKPWDKFKSLASTLGLFNSDVTVNPGSLIITSSDAYSGQNPFVLWANSIDLNINSPIGVLTAAWEGIKSATSAVYDLVVDAAVAGYNAAIRPVIDPIDFVKVGEDEDDLVNIPVLQAIVSIDQLLQGNHIFYADEYSTDSKISIINYLNDRLGPVLYSDIVTKVQEMINTTSMLRYKTNYGEIRLSVPDPDFFPNGLILIQHFVSPTTQIKRGELGLPTLKEMNVLNWSFIRESNETVFPFTVSHLSNSWPYGDLAEAVNTMSSVSSTPADLEIADDNGAYDAIKNSLLAFDRHLSDLTMLAQVDSPSNDANDNSWIPNPGMPTSATISLDTLMNTGAYSYPMLATVGEKIVKTRLGSTLQCSDPSIAQVYYDKGVSIGLFSGINPWLAMPGPHQFPPNTIINGLQTAQTQSKRNVNNLDFYQLIHGENSPLTNSFQSQVERNLVVYEYQTQAPNTTTIINAMGASIVLLHVLAQWLITLGYTDNSGVFVDRFLPYLVEPSSVPTFKYVIKTDSENTLAVNKLVKTGVIAIIGITSAILIGKKLAKFALNYRITEQQYAAKLWDFKDLEKGSAQYNQVLADLKPLRKRLRGMKFAATALGLAATGSSALPEENRALTEVLDKIG